MTVKQFLFQFSLLWWFCVSVWNYIQNAKLYEDIHTPDIKYMWMILFYKKRGETCIIYLGLDLKNSFDFNHNRKISIFNIKVTKIINILSF